MELLVSKKKATALTHLQHNLCDGNYATEILFEGPGNMATSHIINQIISIFEPRNVSYGSIDRVDNENWIEYCMINTASKGRIAFFDRGWYSAAIEDGSNDIATTIMVLDRYESYLYNNNVNVIKIYLDVDEDELKKHNDSYPIDIDGECEAFCKKNNSKKFAPSKSKVSKILEQTNNYFEWDVVKVGNFKDTVREIADILEKRFVDMLRHPIEPKKGKILEIYPNPRETLDFSKKIDGEEYDKKLAKLQKKLAKLQVELANSDKSLILAFEGWDAAGKGSSIKRVTRALNPRGYRVYPIAAPNDVEKRHTHLWRFSTKLPPAGYIHVFDRTWYGRMMVEPIHGFCTMDEYSRAAEEINLFEYACCKSNIIIMKFWIDITKDEQLIRFNARRDNELKQWKLTDEDWRNRERWDEYEKYVDSMIKQTNTSYAPWYVIENNDKKYGRIKVLELIVDTLKKELDD